jgi:2-polyprenyl-3-methyl-5-hydroxy-6-metoxy-1,4-benzoquinol methylase
MNEQTLLAMANDRALCIQLLEKSETLQKIATNHARVVLRNHIDGNLPFDGRVVEVDTDEETLNSLFDIVAEQWRHMGETRPHFSVLSSDEWQPEKLDEKTLAKFYATGLEEVEQFLHMCRRNGMEAPQASRVLEVGCGVGRVTSHLARRFDQVTGVDISPGNLRECAAALKSQSLGNVELIRMQSPKDIGDLVGHDIFFSRIVLQHNPPPIQAYMLQSVLEGLTPGGIAYFQTVTGGLKYRYSIQRHLKYHRVVDFEMHALPMGRVLKTIQEAGCRVVDVFRDLAAGYNVDSYTFLAVKD